MSIFARIVCGVDGSELSTAAAGLAARLAEPEGRLVLVSVEDPAVAVHAGWAATMVAEEIHHDAARALRRAREEAVALHDAEGRLVEGHPADRLLAELERLDATLAVVGSRGHSRAVGIALGSVATMIVHEAPCSVLVGRGEFPRGAPERILAGSDGSPQSQAAVAVARGVASRFGATLDVLRVDDADPVSVLSERSEDAHLLVVGSRGLRGVRAFGSVSERVAHEARCPVLVVR